MKGKWHVLLLTAALTTFCASASAQTQYEFTGGGDGVNWDDSFYGIQANWDPQALPNDADADVWIPSGFSVVGNGSFTVGRLEIDGGSSLEIAHGLNVQAGAFSGSGSIADDGQINIDSLASLTSSGNLSISGAGSLTVANTGDIQSAPGSTTTISVPITMNGGTLQGQGVISTQNLTINGPVTASGLLVTHGALTINQGDRLYIAGAAPLLIEGAGYDPSAITHLVASAYDHGKWDGDGIAGWSSVANFRGTALAIGDNALLGLTTFDNQQIDNTTLILTTTWEGDANCDGVVNSADLSMMKSTGTEWSQGDFNYDGVVNQDDYSLFMFGAAASGGENISATLPEPAGSLLLIPAILLLRRKRR